MLKGVEPEGAKMIIRILAIISIITVPIFTGGPGVAGTYRVPLDYADLQAAMSAAGEGDTVLVAPGTYNGDGNRDIFFGGINRVVISEAGAEQTVIDCEGASRAFLLNDGEDSTSVISGFTITNATGGNGGGIFVSDAAATIEHCVFANNTATSNGGGIYFGYAPSRGYITGCVFYGNTAAFRGGGISCSHGWPPNFPPVISGCVFYDNTAGTGGSHGGGALFFNSCPAPVTGCTIVGNSGGPGAGGIHSFDSGVIARNSIIAFNTGAAGAYNITVERCLLYGNEGEDVLSPASTEMLEIHPLLCNLAERDLTLCSNSPCLPGSAENPWGVLIGFYESGCGECSTSTEESSWGSIKRIPRR
jgi:parallel beta-helix repeat protein